MDASTYAVLKTQQEILRGLITNAPNVPTVRLLGMLDANEKILAEFRHLFEALEERKAS